MKTKLPWILTILLAITLAVVLVARPSSKPSSASVGDKKVLYWIDAMNPTHRFDRPGRARRISCGTTTRRSVR